VDVLKVRPKGAMFNSGTTRLALGTHDRGLPSFEMQIQPRGANDLIDDAEFWQTEQGFDTIDIHEPGSSFWVVCFPEFCQESGTCQLPPKSPIINLIFWPQTWQRANFLGFDLNE
jgi:hypothetical protein